MSLQRDFDQDFVFAGHGLHRCYLCCRAPAEVKRFFGFDQDGEPVDAEAHGIENVMLERLDIMSQAGPHPVYAACHLNTDTISILGEDHALRELGRWIREERGRLGPPGGTKPAAGQ